MESDKQQKVVMFMCSKKSIFSFYCLGTMHNLSNSQLRWIKTLHFEKRHDKWATNLYLCQNNCKLYYKCRCWRTDAPASKHFQLTPTEPWLSRSPAVMKCSNMLAIQRCCFISKKNPPKKTKTKREHHTNADRCMMGHNQWVPTAEPHDQSWIHLGIRHIDWQNRDFWHNFTSFQAAC